MFFALGVMAGELVYLASDILAFRFVVLGSALALIVVAIPRFGLREAYLLTFCAALAVTAFMTADAPWAVLLVAFDQAFFLMAFILLVGLIQQAAQTSSAITNCGLYLTRQPPGRRYFSVFVGTHLMAQLFNLGVVSLLAPLIKQASEANASDALQPLREQRQINAMLRGFSWAVVWSPTAVAPLVVMSLLPDVQRGPWMAVGFGLAVTAMLIGWAEDRWTFRNIRRQLVAGVPRIIPSFPASDFTQLGFVCLALLGLVLLWMWMFDETVIFGLMAASPVILVFWLLSQKRHAQEGALSATNSRIGEILRSYLPLTAPLAVTLACSGFIGRAAAVLLPVETLAEAAGVATMSGWLFLLGLSVGVALLSQFALSPIMMAVFFGSLIAQLPVLPVDVTWAALAISCGWALSMTISPFATVVLMTMQMTGHTGREMTWQWNWRFTALCIVLLALVYAVLTRGG